MKKKPCSNCDFDCDETFSFCPNCGQQANEKLTVGVLFYNTISNYFSFDARFLKSVLPLLFRPGYIASEFVAGKRLQYLHPAQYYLFVSVLFFFLFSFNVRNMDSVMNEQIKKGFDKVNEQISKTNSQPNSATLTVIPKPMVPSIFKNENMSAVERHALDSLLEEQDPPVSIDVGYNLQKLDSLIGVNAPLEQQLSTMGIDKNAGNFEKLFVKQYIKFHKNRGGGILQSFFDTLPIALFVLLPVFAWIVSLVFWKKAPYTHHLVFSFYYFSYLFILLSLMTGLNNFVFTTPDWMDTFVSLLMGLYLWLALWHFYQQSLLRSLWKTCIIVGFNLLVIVPLAFVLILITSFLFY